VEHNSVPVDGVLVADRMAYGSDANGGENYNRPEHARNMGPAWFHTTPATKRRVHGSRKTDC
jgi:hypothetical protein